MHLIHIHLALSLATGAKLINIYMVQTVKSSICTGRLVVVAC